jgi:hypothetical protein
MVGEKLAAADLDNRAAKIASNQIDDDELADRIAQLPADETDVLLLRVGHGGASLARAELLRQLKAPGEELHENEPRTVGELLYRAAQLG